MKNLSLKTFLLLFALACVGCMNQVNEELIDPIEEVESRFAADCDLDVTPTLDQNGCCVYTFNFVPGFYYEIRGVKFFSDVITVCPGESIIIQMFRTDTSILGGGSYFCHQTLTCSCCDQIDFTTNFYQDPENAFCCIVELDFNIPECGDNVEGSIEPVGLIGEYSTETISNTELGYDIRICTKEVYPEDAYLFIKFSMDDECKRQISVPLPSCL